MKKPSVLLFFVAALLLTSCHRATHGPIYNPIVRSIVATAEDRERFLRRYYETDEKMQAIFVCLRRLQPRFSPPLDPSQLQAPTICLVLTCADGTQQFYRLKDTRYLQQGTGPWKTVTADPAADLWQLLWAMEGDPEPRRSFHRPLPRLPHNYTYPRGKKRFF